MDAPASTVRKPKRLKDQKKELQGQLHRLEVEIAASSHVFAQERRRRSRDELPPPDEFRFRRKGKGRRLTLAQASEKRKKVYMQIAEFVVMLLLFIGACSWLIKFWKNMN